MPLAEGAVICDRITGVKRRNMKTKRGLTGNRLIF